MIGLNEVVGICQLWRHTPHSHVVWVWVFGHLTTNATGAWHQSLMLAWHARGPIWATRYRRVFLGLSGPLA